MNNRREQMFKFD